LSLLDRCENADRPVKAGDEIGASDPDLLRSSARFASQIHDSAHPLGNEIIARPMRIGSVLSEAGDRTIDEPWVDGLHGLIVEVEFLQSADLEILDEDVSSGSQAVHKFLPLGTPKIGHDGVLAS